MTTVAERFQAKVATDFDCHVWLGAVNSKGYACFAVDGVSQLAHRVIWEAVRGPIPDGMTVDHLCRVRNCVNVEHLELVTSGENLRRGRRSAGYFIGGECSRGHRLTESNVYRRERNSGIECRTCRALAAAS